MIFKHSAFVQIPDAENRREVIEFLESIGYNKWAFYFEYDGIQIFLDGTFTDTCLPVEDNYIDCGDNIELFKAIAAINDENDYMQWFVLSDNDICISKQQIHKNLRNKSLSKATPEQLQEYFKTK